MPLIVIPNDFPLWLVMCLCFKWAFVWWVCIPDKGYLPKCCFKKKKDTYARLIVWGFITECFFVIFPTHLFPKVVRGWLLIDTYIYNIYYERLKIKIQINLWIYFKLNTSLFHLFFLPHSQIFLLFCFTCKILMFSLINKTYYHRSLSYDI